MADQEAQVREQSRNDRNEEYDSCELSIALQAATFPTEHAHDQTAVIRE